MCSLLSRPSPKLFSQLWKNRFSTAAKKNCEGRYEAMLNVYLAQCASSRHSGCNLIGCSFCLGSGTSILQLVVCSCPDSRSSVCSGTRMSPSSWPLEALTGESSQAASVAARWERLVPNQHRTAVSWSGSHDPPPSCFSSLVFLGTGEQPVHRYTTNSPFHSLQCHPPLQLQDSSGKYTAEIPHSQPHCHGCPSPCPLPPSPCPCPNAGCRQDVEGGRGGGEAALEPLPARAATGEPLWLGVSWYQLTYKA